MNYPVGVDISYALTGVNYVALCANLDFVIMKCGQRNFKDGLFETHYNGCKLLGITMGAYFYGSARTNEQAVAEAQLCASLIRDKDFSLPLFYDVEGSAGDASTEGILYPGPLSGYTVNSIVKSFITELRNQGIHSYGIYTSAYVFDAYLNKNDFTDCYIWAAAWGYSNPPKVWGDKTPDIWQESATSRFPGYPSDLDRDYLITTEFPVKDNQYYYCHPFGMKATETVLDTYASHGETPIDLSLSTGTPPGKLNTVGTPIYSMCDGTVLSSSYGVGSLELTTNPAAGNSVTIQATGTAAQLNNVLNTNDLTFLYCHLVNPNETGYTHFPILRPGDTVRKGQIIGGIGASGHTDDGAGGPFVHLHLDTTARIKSNTKTYNKYHNKQIHFLSVGARTVGDKYNYAIFCEDPILTWMEIEGQAGEDTPLTKVHHVPDEYYINTISDSLITGGGYSRDYMMNIITALSIRETIGYASAGLSDYLKNSVAIYGKLLRARCIFYPNLSLMEVLLAGGFEGFAQLSLESKADPSVRLELLELVTNNFVNPGAYGILSEYLPLISYAPFFNYGYAGLGYPSNDPSVESEIATRIRNGSLISHISNGNTTDLSGCCGNTAYFPPRAWV